VTCGHLNLVKLSCIEQVYACAARSSTARWLELPAVVGVQKYLDYGEGVTTEVPAMRSPICRNFLGCL
jgi:hypothetical protein